MTDEVLHRRLALMFMMVVEGSYTPRERVTNYGINQTLKHLLAAAKSLDDGYYFMVVDALSDLARRSTSPRSSSTICYNELKDDTDIYLQRMVTLASCSISATRMC